MSQTCLLMLLGAGLAAAAPLTRPFENSVRPVLVKYCQGCHNPDVRSGGLDLTRVSASNYEVWEKVSAKLRSGMMPPPPMPKVAAAEVKTVVAAIHSLLSTLDQTAKPEPGRVTARRLNRFDTRTRFETWGSTSRTLSEFPADDSGYGFDNIGDILTVSPVLMEKYVAAARKIASADIPLPGTVKPTSEVYESKGGDFPQSLEVKHHFAVEGDYTFTTTISVTRPGGNATFRKVQILLAVDGKDLQPLDVDTRVLKPRIFDVQTRIPAGTTSCGRIRGRGRPRANQEVLADRN